LLRGDGSAALTDFGIARVPGASLTANGQVLGTPEYMAPEQCQGQKADARSDIYALGVTLYQMLTGHPPFEADPHLSTEQRMLALLRMHVEEPPRPPRAVNPWLPADVDATLLRALAKEPEARYASVTQMMQAVETALRPAVAYTAETRPAVQPTPATGSSGRHQSVPGLPASQIRRDGELRGRYQPDAGGTRCRTLRSALTCTTSTRCCHDPTPSHRQSRARWATDARAAATHPD
jgi:serine/threonine protein kinase